MADPGNDRGPGFIRPSLMFSNEQIEAIELGSRRIAPDWTTSTTDPGRARPHARPPFHGTALAGPDEAGRNGAAAARRPAWSGEPGGRIEPALPGGRPAGIGIELAQRHVAAPGTRWAAEASDRVCLPDHRPDFARDGPRRRQTLQGTCFAFTRKLCTLP
jgi:hypothetical protein